MSTIRIKNIGPIIDITLNLNKVNIIMGKQSSGKSTIAKIISYCLWVEKEVSINQSFETFQAKDYFKDRLESFHKMRGYFKDDTEIEFTSDVICFHFSQQTFKIDWKNQYVYKRSKISYIPAERNMVILPEMEKVELPHNNIRSFLFDWFDARKRYRKGEDVTILNLGVNYYFNEDAKENHIEFNGENNYDILLSNASSGLQSIVPLIVMINYLTEWIYKNEQNISFEAKEKKDKVEISLFTELVVNKFHAIKNKESEQANDNLSKIIEVIEIIKDSENPKRSLIEPMVNNYIDISDNLINTSYTQLIIEEPEQNLFPETQRDLVYFLLNKINDEIRNHSLLITTHSPYILYAINNCMMGFLIKDNMPKDEQKEVLCKQSWIAPSLISVWEIENGKLNRIQGEDGLIGQNYFDTSMKHLMDDFYSMLNYYEYEE